MSGEERMGIALVSAMVLTLTLLWATGLFESSLTDPDTPLPANIVQEGDTFTVRDWTRTRFTSQDLCDRLPGGDWYVESAAVPETEVSYGYEDFAPRYYRRRWKVPHRQVKPNELVVDCYLPDDEIGAP